DVAVSAEVPAVLRETDARSGCAPAGRFRVERGLDKRVRQRVDVSRFEEEELVRREMRAQGLQPGCDDRYLECAVLEQLRRELEPVQPDRPVRNDADRGACDRFQDLAVGKKALDD